MAKSLTKVTIGLVIALILGGCGHHSQSSESTASASSKTRSSVKAKRKQSRKRASVHSSSSSSSTQAVASSQTSSVAVSSSSSSQVAQSSSSGSNTQAQSVDAKTAGVLLCLYSRAEWFKTYIGNAIWYGTIEDKGGGQEAGYDYISAHGDPTSTIFYQVSGDVITYKYVDDSGGQSVADSPTVTKTISLTRLENDYYQTADQQQEVNGYAAQMMADSPR